MESTHTFVVPEKDASKRLDVFLSAQLPGMSRTGVKGLLEKGLVLVDNARSRASHRTRPGESVKVTVPPRPAVLAGAEPIGLDIVYEDEDIIVVNKPRGLTVHPAAGRPGGTLMNALLAHTTALSDVGGPLRPGIVHRLDKDTSGVMVAAKTNAAHLALSGQFKEHSTVRHYHALVWGDVREKSGTVELPIGRDIGDRKKISPRTRKARRAVTHFRVIRRLAGPFTLLDITPETGRTHQIRVHLASIKHPIVGDPVYGKRALPHALPAAVKTAIKKLGGQALHAATLGLVHPASGRHVEFSSPYPAEMKNLLEALSCTVKQ